MQFALYSPALFASIGVENPHLTLQYEGESEQDQTAIFRAVHPTLTDNDSRSNEPLIVLCQSNKAPIGDVPFFVRADTTTQQQCLATVLRWSDVISYHPCGRGLQALVESRRFVLPFDECSAPRNALELTVRYIGNESERVNAAITDIRVHLNHADFDKSAPSIALAVRHAQIRTCLADAVYTAAALTTSVQHSHHQHHFQQQRVCEDSQNDTTTTYEEPTYGENDEDTYAESDITEQGDEEAIEDGGTGEFDDDDDVDDDAIEAFVESDATTQSLITTNVSLINARVGARLSSMRRRGGARARGAVSGVRNRMAAVRNARTNTGRQRVVASGVRGRGGAKKPAGAITGGRPAAPTRPLPPTPMGRGRGTVAKPGGSGGVAKPGGKPLPPTPMGRGRGAKPPAPTPRPMGKQPGPRTGGGRGRGGGSGGGAAAQPGDVPPSADDGAGGGGGLGAVTPAQSQGLPLLAVPPQQDPYANRPLAQGPIGTATRRQVQPNYLASGAVSPSTARFLGLPATTTSVVGPSMWQQQQQQLYQQQQRQQYDPYYTAGTSAVVPGYPAPVARTPARTAASLIPPGHVLVPKNVVDHLLATSKLNFAAAAATPTAAPKAPPGFRLVTNEQYHKLAQLAREQQTTTEPEEQVLNAAVAIASDTDGAADDDGGTFDAAHVPSARVAALITNTLDLCYQLYAPSNNVASLHASPLFAALTSGSAASAANTQYRLPTGGVDCTHFDSIASALDAAALGVARDIGLQIHPDGAACYLAPAVCRCNAHIDYHVTGARTLAAAVSAAHDSVATLDDRVFYAVASAIGTCSSSSSDSDVATTTAVSIESLNVDSALGRKLNAEEARVAKQFAQHIVSSLCAADTAPSLAHPPTALAVNVNVLRQRTLATLAQRAAANNTKPCVSKAALANVHPATVEATALLLNKLASA
jgi:hypothetical protein